MPRATPPWLLTAAIRPPPRFHRRICLTASGKTSTSSGPLTNRPSSSLPLRTVPSNVEVEDRDCAFAVLHAGFLRCSVSLAYSASVSGLLAVSPDMQHVATLCSRDIRRSAGPPVRGPPSEREHR